MIRITSEEVQKLAEISKLKVSESEMAGGLKDLEAVLSYAAKVVEVGAEIELQNSTKNVNVMREDTVVTSHSAPILSQAPISEDGYFVVPKIIENN